MKEKKKNANAERRIKISNYFVENAAENITSATTADMNGQIQKSIVICAAEKHQDYSVKNYLREKNE